MAKDVVNVFLSKVMTDVGNAERLNVWKKLGMVLGFIKSDSTGFYRPLYLPLRRIKQHVNQIGYVTSITETKYRLTEVDVLTCIGFLADVIVHSRFLSNCNLKEAEAIETSATAFYVQYRSISNLFGIAVKPESHYFNPPLHQPPAVEPESSAASSSSSSSSAPLPEQAECDEYSSPPQYASISSFKKNGWDHWLKKCVIIPQTGEFKNEECVFVSYTGHTSIVKNIRTNSHKYINSSTVIVWKRKSAGHK
jgi:hypothetical protein